MKSLVLYNDDGNETVLPHKWEICSQCRGEGKSSAYLGAFTTEEMAEEGPEFMEDYASGFYDRTCDICGGCGKVKIADRSRMTKAQRKAWDAQQQSDAEVEGERMWERRMLYGLERGY